MEQKASMSFSNVFDIQEKEVTHKCDQHGESQSKIFFLKEKWCASQCSQCIQDKEDEDLEKLERFKKRELEIGKKSMIESSLGRAMIPARFKDHSFETFLVQSREQEKKKSYCLNYAEGFDAMLEKGTSVIFCGKTGTGKTHLACAIANYIIKEKQKTAVFTSVIRAIRQVKDTYSRKNGTTEQEALDWFLDPDLLILDEVGVQFGTDTEKNILFEILNERYQNMRPTILISNLEPKELSEFIGDRVVDRMKDNQGSLLQFEWESYRGKRVASNDKEGGGA